MVRASFSDRHPAGMKEGLTIIPVSHVSEVIANALTATPDAIEWDEAAEEAAAAAAALNAPSTAPATTH